ncbi:MAG TPA: sulfatase-like hydrolase/transferase, partial [Verrucomicrobiae bacterium]|nr:sulfatase-like hydrolase/transferase [Verrucomicrobiae bacterium]
MLPLIRGAAFVAAVSLYRLAGWLNSSQAGKAALLGGLAVACVSAWSTLNGREGRAGRLLNQVTATLFFFILGFEAFLRDLFGVAHDSRMVTEAIFGTNGSEATEFFLHNRDSILKHTAVVLALSAAYWLLLRRTSPTPPAGTRGGRLRAAVVLTVAFLALHANSTMRKADPVLYFPIRYLGWRSGLEKVKALQKKLENATAGSLASVRFTGRAPRTLVFVIGESTTRLNWGMYGYPRPTTPELDAVGKELVRFTDVVTCDGSTVLALEKMLTAATVSRPDLWMEKPDILSIARKAGYKSF